MVELCSNRGLTLNLDMHRIGKAVPCMVAGRDFEDFTTDIALILQDSPDIGERPEPLESTIDVTDPAMTPEQWVNYTKRNFNQVYKEGVEGFPRMMSLGLHLRIIGRPGRIWALEEFFRHVCKAQDIWVITRHSIAQHLAKVEPA